MKTDGNAGGVRGGRVAVGKAVSVGSGVAVTRPAITVWTAWVMIASMSCVGGEDDGDRQPVNITASRPRLRMMRESRCMRAFYQQIHAQQRFEGLAKRSFYALL